MSGQASPVQLSLASEQDIDDIVDLLQANEEVNGGSLTGHFDPSAIRAAIHDLPVVIARVQQRLAGVLLSFSIAATEPSPVIAGMLKTYRGDATAYIYGPICIDRRERGRGIAEMLFARLKAELSGREGILFIRRDNVASLRAHQDKLAMAPRGDFEVNGAGYTVFSYR
jgi:hypothetical protein